jgi:hypothetical protein
MQARICRGLVLDELLMAVGRRQFPDEIVVHSPQGSKFVSHYWLAFEKAHGLVARISSLAHDRFSADLHAQRVEEDHRVHRFERAALPSSDLGHDRVGDRADEIGADLSAVLLGQKPLDLAHRHAARVHRHDLVVKAREAALVLGNQQRLEGASRSRGTSMRTGPSSMRTVLPLAPLRWLHASSGLSCPCG